MMVEKKRKRDKNKKKKKKAMPKRHIKSVYSPATITAKRPSLSVLG